MLSSPKKALLGPHPPKKELGGGAEELSLPMMLRSPPPRREKPSARGQAVTCLPLFFDCP